MLSTYRLTITYALIVLICTGCNLPQNDDPILDAAATVPVSSTAPAANGVDDCIIRTDWPEYTVQPGDTLTRIADITESTIPELVAGNCLDNPNRLDRGQVIRVPRLPEIP